MDLIRETRVFSDALDRLPLPAGVSHVYNPLSYMRAAHERWLGRFVPCGYEEVAPRTIPITSPMSRPYLILGMNPGPWGMVQTGVPFGDVVNAKALLALTTTCPHPARAGRHEWYMHPPDRVVCHACGDVEQSCPLPGILPTLHSKCPILGFKCTRREASGERLWCGLSGVWEKTLASPDLVGADIGRKLIDAVLRDCFAVNYCPLAYFADDGKGTNVTPDAFRKSGPYRDLPYANELDALCARYIAAILEAFKTRVALAVGRYAETMVKVITSAMPADARPKIVYLTHPSPLATHSAVEWAEMCEREMSKAGVLPARTGGVS